MDSLTQIVLGGAVAAVVAPSKNRRAALLAGACLGTLPDVDSLLLLLADDPVVRMTVHRSFTHSLFVLPLLGWGIWWLFLRYGNGRVAASPRRWLWAIELALITHPLLDSFTVYGTQLWWPLRPHPTMWSSIFTIDPLYTVWLGLACVVAWLSRARKHAQRMLVLGLMLSSGYLGWSLLAKYWIDNRAEQVLATMGLADAPHFSGPTPFNTLLWQVVVMTPDGYLVGEHSLLSDRGPMRFTHYSSQVAALAEVAQLPAVKRLGWYNRGFMRASVVNDELLLSDLRMGLEQDYSFNFLVARRVDGQWQGVEPRQMAPAYSMPAGREDAFAALARIWQRIWHRPLATA